LEKRKQLLLKDYPGIGQHLGLLEDKIADDPLSGTKTIITSQGKKDIPALALSTETNFFSGALAYYGKELTVVYICSGDLSSARIIQILF
jgi:hypothetical protein